MKENAEKMPAPPGTHGTPKIAFIIFLVLLGLMSFIFGFMIFSYLLALAAGAMLALLCYPLFRKLVGWGVSTQISSILLTIAIILLVVIPISIFLLFATEQGIEVAGALSGNDDSVNTVVEKISNWDIVGSLFQNSANAKRQIHEWLKRTGTITVSMIVAVASEIPNLLFQVAIIIISFFYFLIDGPRLVSWFYARIPLDLQVREKVMATFANTTISVMFATLAVASLHAIIAIMVFLALSVPAVFLATAATFILAWIPIIGSAPVWIAGALYLYSNGLLLKTILILLFGVLTGILDYIVRPLFFRGRSRMHPLVSLMAIFGGIQILGILGVFIGPIIAAIMISLWQILPVIQHRVEVSQSPENTQ